PRQFTEHIDIASHQLIFSNDDYRISKLGKYLETLTGQPEPAFDWLICIGYAAYRNHFWLPLRRSEFFAKQLRRVFLHQDPGLEIQTGRKPEVLVIGPSVTIDTSVLAAAVRVDAC